MTELSEQELCKDLRQFLEIAGLVVYPEVEGIDLVATTSPHVQAVIPGLLPTDHLLIQAKLAANVEVLWQAVSSRYASLRYVAVRRASDTFIALARHLGLGVLVMEEYNRRRWDSKGWERPALGWRIYPTTRRWEGTALRLPSIVTDLPAGSPSPRALTRWRENALRLCHRLRTRGYVTSADFKELGLSANYWTASRYKGVTLLQGVDKIEVAGKKLKRYVVTPGCEARLPDAGWEAIQAELVAKLEKSLDTPTTPI